MRFSKVGVVGAGCIGTGVVTDLVLHDITVVVIDTSNDALRKCKADILKNVRFARLYSKDLPSLTPDEVLARVVFSENLQDVESSEFIVENVTEQWDIKQSVYKTLDCIMAKDVCFGANTSCFSITKLASLTSRPANVVGVHFMNPVHQKNTVEVVRGFHTSEPTVELLQVLLKQLNKESITVEDFPGFVSNRISHLFFNEAAFVLQDKVATPEKIDAIFKKCFSHQMGPLETADLIGLDTVVQALDVLYNSYQDPKYRCCPLLRKMVDAGYLGRKTGRGFYVYPEV